MGSSRSSVKFSPTFLFSGSTKWRICLHQFSDFQDHCSALEIFSFFAFIFIDFWNWMVRWFKITVRDQGLFWPFWSFLAFLCLAILTMRCFRKMVQRVTRAFSPDFFFDQCLVKTFNLAASRSSDLFVWLETLYRLGWKMAMIKVTALGFTLKLASSIEKLDLGFHTCCFSRQSWFPLQISSSGGVWKFLAP